MEIKKGTKLKMTSTNSKPMFKNTTANSVLVYEVVKVNPKSYTLKCVEGYMKNTGCKLKKDFAPVFKNEYGTVTTWEII